MIASCPSVACPNSRTLARLSIPKDCTLTVGFPTKTGFSGSVPRLRSLRTPPILLRFYGDNTTVTFALADSGVRAQCPIQHSAELRHAETFTRHCTRKHTDGGAGTDYSGLSAPFSLSPKNAGSHSERQRARPCEMTNISEAALAVGRFVIRHASPSPIQSPRRAHCVRHSRENLLV